MAHRYSNLLKYGKKNFRENEQFTLQVLAATQTPGEAGKKWFQGTADAVRQFIWVFEVGFYNFQHALEKCWARNEAYRLLDDLCRMPRTRMWSTY